MTQRRSPGIRGMTVVLVGAVAAALALGGTVAQADHGHDDHDGHAFGAWIYEGRCDALASSPLAGIGDLEVDDDGDTVNKLGLTPPVPSPIWSEDEDIDATAASLTSSPHAVVVRATEDVSSDVIACGDITNVLPGDAPFSIDLLTVGDSGYTGSARFSADIDKRGSEIDVVVGVWEGTSQATPASGTPVA